MDVQWLSRKGCESLIVFCNGWGMDRTPFNPLGSIGYDVLICSDYTDESGVPEVEELTMRFSELILVGWSMGVAFGQKFFSKKSHLFKKRIAINGTLCPRHDAFGIPGDVFDSTLAGLNENSLMKFYHRMCRSRGVLNVFLENKPVRTIESQVDELHAISRGLDCTDEEESIYSDVIISTKDLIIPTGNQKRFWQNSTSSLVPGHHFPFYQWKTWDNIVQLHN